VVGSIAAVIGVIVASAGVVVGNRTATAANASANAARQQADLAQQERDDRIRREQHLADAAGTINFAPRSTPIPRCASLSGSADVVEGWTLWIAHKGENGGYFMRKPDRQVGDEWFIDRWTIGGEDGRNQSYELIGFYVDVETSRFIEALKVHSQADSRASWYSMSLPPGIKGKKSSTIHRGSETGQKSCAGSSLGK
jgi:hypothetical protein